MLFHLDTKSTVAMYEQLEEQIANYVFLGVLEQNEKLPSVRALAGELGINPNTVAKAYKLLELKNIIYTIAGKGVYIGAKEYAEGYVREKTLTALQRSIRQAQLAGIPAEKLHGMIEAVYKGGSEDD